ncbi:MAG: hypothetical protein Q4G50_04010 [Corynebacterium sp.]|uniref:hypothetical protein n=1 Tax=Corynebacterium sp. TaxID=1720 RepID=UPI0026DF0375|nr:hypothetical protein [Corynebacterium sp.]MDO5669147.1 hypothetical protein [Corynebacterium sp.]
MGFWNRLFSTGADRIIDARAAGTTLPRRWRTPEPEELCCDPREAAQILLLALDNAEALGFVPRREITVDDIDFNFYNGPQGFRLEHLSALLRLSDEDGGSLFPRAMVFDAECVESNDTYAQLLWQIADAAGTTDRFAEVHCDLHFGPDFADNPVGEMSYLCGGEARQLDIAVEGEWADPDVVRHLFEDATPEGHRWVPTGDYGIHVWVPEEHADEVARIFATEDTAAEARIAGHLHRERHGE